jgi:hypothetical protein
MLSDNQRRWKERFDRAKDEVLEVNRQREVDRLASEANPPKPYDGSLCQIDHETGLVCVLGTVGCKLHHDASDPIPSSQMEANAKAWDEQRKRDSHYTGD